MILSYQKGTGKSVFSRLYPADFGYVHASVFPSRREYQMFRKKM